MDDSYKTVSGPSEGYINEKKSKFLSFLFPVKSADEAMGILEEYRKKYYNARHVCWAYMLGWERKEFRYNDDGEPSGTAGKPILGQINSFELTDVLILVVRYFGGTLLGTGGLIKAYREAAADAIANAEIITRTVDDVIVIDFEYIHLHDVIIRLEQFEEVEWSQDFKASCLRMLRARRSLSRQLCELLSSIYGVDLTDSK